MNTTDMARLLRFSAVSIALLMLKSFAGVSTEKLLSRTVRDSHVVTEHAHGEGEAFVTIGNYLLDEELSAWRISRDFESNHDGAITKNQVQTLVSILFSRLGCEQRVENCTKCVRDLTSDLFAALDLNDTQGFTAESLLEASPMLLYLASRLEAACAPEQGARTLDEDAVFGALRSVGTDGSNETLTEEDLAEILHIIDENYTATTQALCFDVESLFVEFVSDHEAGANASETHVVAESVVANLLRGYCIGEATLPTAEAFTDAVFQKYATGGYILEIEFFEILELLGIGNVAGQAHAGHAHRRRRAVEVRVVESFQSTHRREKRVVDSLGHVHAQSGGVPNVTETCLTGEQLLDTHGVDHQIGISEAQFNSMAPSLVQQILSGACAFTNTTAASTIDPAKIWGYGTLAVFVISLCSVIGALFIPCMSGFIYEAIIQALIALAVATLTGDAILHLIPQAVGLHAHDTTTLDVHSVHGPSNPELAYVWKCLVVVMAIYAFFLFEAVSGFLSCGAHTHSHGGQHMEMNGKDLDRRNSARVYKKTSSVNLANSKKNLTDEENGSSSGKKRGFWTGCGPIAGMIVLGDSLHNFGDGLAIGAAFSVGLGPGVSTSIAVLCHELPHELGDLAVLLNQGMSLCSAICLNFLSACTAFIGLWVGIPVSQNQTVREWIFAATAGTFLYVGLVSMLPQLHSYRGKNRAAIFFLQNIGFLVGAAIILVIAFYEDAITVSV